MQAADVRLHVAAAGDDLAHVVLHIAAAARPKLAAAAERRHVVEVRVVPRDALELVAIVEAVVVARAEDQPVLVAAIAFRLLEQPMNDAANGRNAGPGGDEDCVLARLAQGEKAVRAVKLDGRAFRQIAQPVRQEAFLHAIEAQIEGGVLARGRGDGVRAGVLFAIGPGLLDGDKLPRNEAEFFHSLDAKLEMLGLRRQQNGPAYAGGEHLPLDRRALLNWGFHDCYSCRCSEGAISLYNHGMA